MSQDAVDRIMEQWARARPDLDVSPVAVAGRLLHLSVHLRQLLERDAHAPFGLHGGRYDVLAALRRVGPPYRLTPTAFYQALMLSSGAITNRLDRLEQEGLIVRLPDPSDRRGVLIELTPKGLELIDQAAPVLLAAEERFLAPLTAAERRTLTELLRKLLLACEGEV